MNLMQPWNIIKHQTVIRPGRDLCPLLHYYKMFVTRIDGLMMGREYNNKWFNIHDLSSDMEY